MIGIYIEIWVLVIALFVFCPLWALLGYWLGWRAQKRRVIEDAMDFIAAREAHLRGERLPAVEIQH